MVKWGHPLDRHNDRHTHTAENNTFLQLRLRAVKFFNTNLPTSSQEVKFPELPAAFTDIFA